MTATGTPTEQAKAILAEARALGVRVAGRDGIVTVSVTFTPGDVDAYRNAERACNDVLRLVRQTRAGSTWGTDSGSVGGHTGLEKGVCTMNKSGADKRVVKILSLRSGADRILG